MILSNTVFLLVSIVLEAEAVTYDPNGGLDIVMKRFVKRQCAQRHDVTQFCWRLDKDLTSFSGSALK
jgi:hypothetical protein